jgi:hypothetical protein
MSRRTLDKLVSGKLGESCLSVDARGELARWREERDGQPRSWPDGAEANSLPFVELGDRPRPVRFREWT